MARVQSSEDRATTPHHGSHCFSCLESPYYASNWLALIFLPKPILLIVPKANQPNHEGKQSEAE